MLCGGPATVHTAAAAIGGHRERHGREEDVEREALGEGEEEGAEPQRQKAARGQLSPRGTRYGRGVAGSSVRNLMRARNSRPAVKP